MKRKKLPYRKLVKKHKSGNPVNFQDVMGMTTMLSAAIPSNPDVNKLEGAQTKEMANQVVSSAANAAVPGLGTAIDIGKKISDAATDVECDEVTGECVDKTTGAKSLTKMLDPVGRIVDMGKAIGEGDMGALASAASFGLVKDPGMAEKLAKIRRQKRDRANIEANTASATERNRRIASERMEMQSSPTMFGNYAKKGGRLLSVKRHQNGGDVLKKRDLRKIRNEIYKESPLLQSIGKKKDFRIFGAEGRAQEHLKQTGRNPEYVGPSYDKIPYLDRPMDEEEPITLKHRKAHKTLIDTEGMSEEDVKEIARLDFVSHGAHENENYNKISEDLNKQLISKFGEKFVKNNGGVDAYVRAIMAGPNSDAYGIYHKEMKDAGVNIDDMKKLLEVKYEKGGLFDFCSNSKLSFLFKRGGRVDKESMPCNKPRKSPNPKKKKVVKGCENGKEKIVHYGAVGYSDYTKHKNKKRRANFRARHKCKTAKSKLTARYWACSDLW